jgi:hypothetical protein
MPPALDPGKREQARKLRKAGASLTKIKRELGISYGSAQRFTKGVRPDLERPSEVAEKITAARAGPHAKWVESVSRGRCGTAGCSDPSCGIDFGSCHCGCGEPAAIADQDDRKRNYVKGEPRLYTKAHKGTLMATGDGVPLAQAIARAGLTGRQLGRRAGLANGVVADLIGLRGYRLHRHRCESLVRFLRDELERQNVDASDMTLERLFTPESPADESPGKRPAHRTQRNRPPLPPSERYNGRHFKEASKQAVSVLKDAGLWTREQTADYLCRAPGTVTHRQNRARLRAEIIRVGPLLYTGYRELDVKRLARDELRSSLPWLSHFRDPEFVREWARDHGADRQRARELAELTRKRNREHARIRVGTGRPKADGPPAYHWDWTHRFLELKAELDERHAAFHVQGDPPPSSLGVAELVALEDFAQHPGRWEYDPGDRPDKASRRVWGAVKQLIQAVSETPLA